MNTRLQVEHPVTEMIVRQDLVEWQLKVAAGMKLPLTQADLKIYGHALEARVYAENPENNFLPMAGKIFTMKEPKEVEGLVRVDTGVRAGDEISSYYDPMIAKLIVWGETRDKAITNLHSALSDFHVTGVPTNIKFMKTVLRHDVFKKGTYDTSFIQKYQKDLLNSDPVAPSMTEVAAASLIHIWNETREKRAKREY